MNLHHCTNCKTASTTAPITAQLHQLQAQEYLAASTQRFSVAFDLDPGSPDAFVLSYQLMAEWMCVVAMGWCGGAAVVAESAAHSVDAADAADAANAADATDAADAAHTTHTAHAADAGAAATAAASALLTPRAPGTQARDLGAHISPLID